MSQSVTFRTIPGARVEVHDLPLFQSPERLRVPSAVVLPRLAVVGRITRRVCSDCMGFERVVTLAGPVTCSNPVHTEPASKPSLPMRPTPHERDGRQEPPVQPARPRTSLLVG
ncbi:hypothetical protein ACFQ7A_04965 [Streptomyces sp. NPDC056528]|uniref:hypothetical protein n=1 Tax=Streptomyces sp. NPDC056528 TaxID=3345854 RepID=UPI003686CFD1